MGNISRGLWAAFGLLRVGVCVLVSTATLRDGRLVIAEANAGTPTKLAPGVDLTTSTTRWVPKSTPVWCTAPQGARVRYTCTSLEGGVAPFSVVPANTNLRVHTLDARSTGTGRFVFSLGPAAIAFRHDTRKTIASPSGRVPRIEGQIQMSSIRTTSTTPMMVLEGGTALDGTLSYQTLAGPSLDSPQAMRVWGELYETARGALGAPARAVDRIPIWCGAPSGAAPAFTCAALDHSIPDFDTVPAASQLRLHRVHLYPVVVSAPHEVHSHYFTIGGASVDFLHRSGLATTMSSRDSAGRIIGASLYGLAENRTVDLHSATPFLVVGAGTRLTGQVGVNELLVDQRGASAIYQTAIVSEDFNVWGELLIDR